MSELPRPANWSPEVAKALAAADLGPDLPEPMHRALIEALVWVCRLDASQADRPS